MEHQALIPSLGQDGDGTHGFGDRGDRVVPHRRLVGEVLGEIADRRDARLECVDRIRSGGGETDHEVPHVRLNRDGVAHFAPLLGRRQHRARFSRDTFSELLWNGHPAIQADARSIDHIPFILRDSMDVAEGFGGSRPGTQSDVGVVHDGALTDAPLLVCRLGRNVHLLTEEGAPQLYVISDRVSLGDERARTRKLR